MYSDVSVFQLKNNSPQKLTTFYSSLNSCIFLSIKLNIQFYFYFIKRVYKRFSFYCVIRKVQCIKIERLHILELSKKQKIYTLHQITSNLGICILNIFNNKYSNSNFM